MADEIQTGLGRTGSWFACQYEGVQPDLYILGKALSGGFYPVSAVVEAGGGRWTCFIPAAMAARMGEIHLGCAVARAALRVIEDEKLVDGAARLGSILLDALKPLEGKLVVNVRGRGLLVGLELAHPARPYCERLMERGVLCKETHEHVIRLAPPLVIGEADLSWMIDQVRGVLTN